MSIDPSHSNPDRQDEISAMSEADSSTEEPEQIEETIWSLSEVMEELRATEEDLRQQNIYLEQERQKYQDLFNFAPDGYLVTNQSGIIQSANQAISNLLEVKQSYLINKPLIIFIDRQDYSLFYTQLNRQSALDCSGIWEINLQSHTGKIFPAELAVKSIYENSGTLTDLRWLIRDISDRKQAESSLKSQNITLERIVIERDQTAQALKKLNQELEDRVKERTAELLQATRLKDEFFANMSHELRTPLNAILGLSEALQEQLLGSLNERQQKSISIVTSSGQHLLALINDILELSKIEARKLELNLTTVSVKALCKSSLAFVNQQAFDRDIQLIVTLAPNLGNIKVDERRMRQVLINLLANGVKFTPTGGQVTLEVRLEDNNLDPDFDRAQELLNSRWMLISVKDTGIGITPENQSKLFQPFVQIDSSLNRQYEGTGLGLMLVKQIVELHGGVVSVSSELGRGSRFVVRLPYNTLSESNRNTVPSIDPIASQNSLAEPLLWSIDPASVEIRYPLILIAEDNQSNLYSISTYLEACNYRLIFATNGLEAIKMAQTEFPDLILMDIQMPEIDGLEAISTIRKHPQLAKMPIIALTALAMDSDKEKCLAAGANEYLAKPVKMKQLRTTIQQLLSGFTGFKDQQD